MQLYKITKKGVATCSRDFRVAARCGGNFGSHKVKFIFLKMRMRTLSDGVVGALDSIVCHWVFLMECTSKILGVGALNKKKPSILMASDTNKKVPMNPYLTNYGQKAYFLTFFEINRILAISAVR
jgi:hypothetical protein